MKAKIKLICVIICILMTMCSCDIRFEPMKPAEAEMFMRDIQLEEREIIVYSDPATAFSIKVTDELVALFNFSQWTTCSDDYTLDRANSMLYFDISHSEQMIFSRVCVLSNGYSLIQVNVEGEFNNSVWYNCNFEKKDTYVRLVDYVTKFSC